MTASAQPLVSVVTPVFNGAEYLEECIESVLRQTYQNWDYTIVDNCSTDATVQIARRYAARDSRIRVLVHDEFLRAIPNHNRAFAQISPQSKYCKMVFGDDWLFPECLERMVAVAEKYPSVGLVSAYAIEGRRVAWTGLPYPNEFVPGRQICRQHLLESLYVFGSATTVMYRADRVRSRAAFFNEGNIHADTEACFDLLKTSDFGFVHQVLTFTRVRERSLTALSNDLQTSWGGMLQILAAHGRHYLTEEEWEERQQSYLAGYYSFLAKSVLKHRDEKFWSYHKGKLNELGVGFSRMRLAVALIKGIGNALLEPKRIVARVVGSRQEGTEEQAGHPSTVPAKEIR